MKRIKLRKWVKVVITLIIFLISVKIYAEMGQIQTNSISNINYQLRLVLCWTWLIIGQTMCYMILWEK